MKAVWGEVLTCQFFPQLLLFLVLFGANLYLMCNISVGLDQDLALPKVSLAFSQPFVLGGAAVPNRWSGGGGGGGGGGA